MWSRDRDGGSFVDIGPPCAQPPYPQRPRRAPPRGLATAPPAQQGSSIGAGTGSIGAATARPVLLGGMLDALSHLPLLVERQRMSSGVLA